MPGFVIYHNPRCSKSRQTLALLRQHGVEPQIRLYMKQPADEAELRELASKLDMRPAQLLRRNEQAFRDFGLDAPEVDDARVLACMAREPRLMERPVVVCGARAVIGRPPEAALALMQAT